MSANSSATGLVWDRRYLDHKTDTIGPYGPLTPQTTPIWPDRHPECPERLIRMKMLIDVSQLKEKLVPIPPRKATIDEIRMAHTKEYIEKVQRICEEGGGDAGEGAPMSIESYEVARLAAGGALAAVEAVMERRVANAYALIRPPGHHAVADLGKGFCVFNNVVIAAKFLQEQYRLTRILIVDWDVHHGNGTQDAFYEDPAVLFVSTHQDQLYPVGYGDPDQVGKGKGEGFTVNIPFPPGTGDRGYLLGFERIIKPIALQFRPEFVLISAGQDPSLRDPLGRQMVTMKGFRQLATILREVAEECCQGRLVALQEGGYSLAYVPYATLGVLEGLSQLESGVVDSSRCPPENYGEHTERWIERVVEIQRRYWKLP
ncbi:MAG: class II histone deacetylase [Candidatus Tectomicrobia bacterium]|nr:class II histone deacetylase [Candidatus Tectomicrobia bacterium]